MLSRLTPNPPAGRKALAPRLEASLESQLHWCRLPTANRSQNSTNIAHNLQLQTTATNQTQQQQPPYPPLRHHWSYNTTNLQSFIHDTTIISSLTYQIGSTTNRGSTPKHFQQTAKTRPSEITKAAEKSPRPLPHTTSPDPNSLCSWKHDILSLLIGRGTRGVGVERDE